MIALPTVPGKAAIACESVVLQQPTWIRSLSAEEAAGGYCTAAIRAVSQVADELGMDPESLTVTLFVRSTPDNPEAREAPGAWNGFTPDGDKVFLSAELAIPQLFETAAHETRHVWQIREGQPAFRSNEALEHDARTFGRAWAQKYLRKEWRRQRPDEPVPEVFA